MKTILLITLLTLTSLFAKGQEVPTLNDLKQGDTFSLKITVSEGVVGHTSIWDFDQVQKVDVQFNVISVDKDSIRLGVKPTNWYACFQNKEQYDQNSHNGFKFWGYYDSFVFGYNISGEGRFDVFRDNNVVAAVNRNDGKTNIHFVPIPEDKAIFSNKDRREWFSSILSLTTGVKIRDDGSTSFGEVYIEFDKVLKTTMERFAQACIKNSKEGKPMPWSVDMRDITQQVPQTPTFVQITSASFRLQPNVLLTYMPPIGMPEYRVFITNGMERIKPAKKVDGAYIFDFFLPAPKRLAIDGVLLDLTPDDVLKVEYDQAKNHYTFTGNGAANCAYTNDIVKFYKKENRLREYDFKFMTYPGWKDMSQEEVNDYFAKGKARHKDLLARYAKEMNPYWLRSAELSYNYWYASEKIYINNVLKDQRRLNFNNPIPVQYQIDWMSEEFGAIFPFADYLYQPYAYGYFLNNYSDYKALQISDDMLTGFNSLRVHIPKYYYANAIFWGYPRFYLTSETLKYLMTDFELKDSQREYEDFVRRCNEPELKKTIVAMHEQLAKVEPGANIKGLDLDIEKYIPLKNNSDGYTVLLVDDGVIEPYDLSLSIKHSNKESDEENDYLREKITVCVITSESRKSVFESKENLRKHITVVSDQMLRDYRDKVIGRQDCYIIMRNDGTILSSHLSGKHDYGIFILSTVKEDIEKQNSNDTASSGIVVVILTSLFSIVVTFFLVRAIIQRRERTKRQISELELKAIRAQMNPHFTFNALGSIQNLINQKKDREANDYLVNFAKLLRMVLSTSERRLITLSEEIEQLELYLRLEQLRVPFQYTIRVDENIDAENEEIPGMLIQPIVENAIKHAIIPQGGGEIKLDFTLAHQVLYVTVSDSGAGYFESENASQGGFGLQAVRERLRLLNKELKLEIGMKIENIQTEGRIAGCKVTISIPV